MAVKTVVCPVTSLLESKAVAEKDNAADQNYFSSFEKRRIIFVCNNDSREMKQGCCK